MTKEQLQKARLLNEQIESVGDLNNLLTGDGPMTIPRYEALASEIGKNVMDLFYYKEDNYFREGLLNLIGYTLRRYEEKFKEI